MDILRYATRCAVLLLALFVVSEPVRAFRMIQNNTTGRVFSGYAVTCGNSGGFAHWNTLDIRWRLNQANQGVGKVTSLRNALESWNDVTGAGHVLTYDGATNAGYVTDNVNTVLWDTDSMCVNGCIALTALVLQSGQTIVESDILMRNDLTWTTNSNPYNSEAVLAHELGHSLGIHHTEISTSPRPTMYQYYFGAGGKSLHSDDREALRCAFDRYHPCAGAPTTPAYISGPNHDLCQLATETYTTPHVPGATSYRWEVVGTSFSRITENNEVSITGQSFAPGTYTLRVRAQNECGSSAWRSVNIFVLSWSDPYCNTCSGWFCF